MIDIFIAYAGVIGLSIGLSAILTILFNIMFPNNKRDLDNIFIVLVIVIYFTLGFVMLNYFN